MTDIDGRPWTARRRASVAVVGAGVVALGLVIAGLAVFGQPRELMNAEEDVIARVMEDAIGSDYAALTPPQRDAAGRVPEAVIATMHDRARTIAAAVFGEPYRSDWLRRIDAAIDEQGADNPYLGGGVRSTSLWRIRIDGDHATASVRAVIYLDTLPIDDQPGIHPVNTADYSFSLVRIDGAWLVATYSFEFTPGGGP